MDKRRQKGANWYMMEMDARRELMRSHGLIGRSYAGKVKQIISGSIGFDDHEWGVTLFAHDVLEFKNLFTKCALMKFQLVMQTSANSSLVTSWIMIN